MGIAENMHFGLANKDRLKVFSSKNYLSYCYDYFSRKKIEPFKVQIKIIFRSCVFLVYIYDFRLRLKNEAYRNLLPFIFNQLNVALFKEIRCPSLLDPINGAVDTRSTLIDGVATYSCNPGFTLTGGNVKRTCAPNGTWTGISAECSGTETKEITRVLNRFKTDTKIL